MFLCFFMMDEEYQAVLDPNDHSRDQNGPLFVPSVRRRCEESDFFSSFKIAAFILQRKNVFKACFSHNTVIGNTSRLNKNVDQKRALGLSIKCFLNNNISHHVLLLVLLLVLYYSSSFYTMIEDEMCVCDVCATNIT